MARKNQKRAYEFRQFREWKKQQKKYRDIFERSEVFHRGIFEDYQRKVMTGENPSLDFMLDSVMKVGTLRMVLDEMDDTMEIVNKIPSLRFQPDWDVQVLPSFMGATSRLWINGYVSVYLDYHNRLGIMGGAPYWEVYHGDDPVRFRMNDSVSMMDYINAVIEKEETNETAHS